MSGNLMLDNAAPESFASAVPATSTPGRRGSLLLAHFREFYAELVRMKGEAARRQSLYLPEAEMQPLQAASTVEEIWQRLLAVLEQQARAAGVSQTGVAFDAYREAQYVMAVLADEVFLNLDWEGKTRWPLLESHLFHMHAAGDLFFQKLDRLLAQGGNAYLDLAALYFYALALGFQGKYRNRDDHGQLERYRKQLFLLIYRRDPNLLDPATPLFPQTQGNVLSGEQRRLLPDPRHWMLLFALVIVVWLGVTDGLWHHLTIQVHQLLCRINPAACTMILGGR